MGVGLHLKMTGENVFLEFEIIHGSYYRSIFVFLC